MSAAAQPAAQADDPMDVESKEWIRDLQSDGPSHDRAIRRLHEFLLRVARAEAARRRARVPESVQDELEDLCVQSASDAVLAVIRKLDTFRGAARFTTWACKFVILEFSTRLRRRIWRYPVKSMAGESLSAL